MDVKTHFVSNAEANMRYVDPKKTVHPLRHTLKPQDWDRIQTAMEQENVEAVTDEELDAVNDVLYDLIVAKMQTVVGVTTLQ